MAMGSARVCTHSSGCRSHEDGALQPTSNHSPHPAPTQTLGNSAFITDLLLYLKKKKVAKSPHELQPLTLSNGES